MRIFALGTGLVLQRIPAAPADDAVRLPEVEVTEEKPTEGKVADVAKAESEAKKNPESSRKE